jgi:hypothetical protein
MIQLDDNLIAVLVPQNSKGYKLTKTHIEYRQMEDGREFNASQKIEGDYEIVGSVTKSYEFDFNCESYVNRTAKGYFNYCVRGKYLRDKELSFLSLLNSKRIFLKKMDSNVLILKEK